MVRHHFKTKSVVDRCHLWILEDAIPLLEYDECLLTSPSVQPASCDRGRYLSLHVHPLLFLDNGTQDFSWARCPSGWSPTHIFFSGVTRRHFPACLAVIHSHIFELWPSVSGSLRVTSSSGPQKAPSRILQALAPVTS